MGCGLLLWLTLLGTPARTGGELPPLPDSFELTAVAREMTGYAIGEVLDTRSGSGGHEFPVRLHTGGSPESSVPRGTELYFRWEPWSEPGHLGSPTDPAYTYRKEALCIFAEGRRLLVVSYESEGERGRLLSALHTARFASSRFTDHELNWAWFASRGCDFGLPRTDRLYDLVIADAVFGVAHGVQKHATGLDPWPGHVELVLRFGGREKQDIIAGLGTRRALDTADVEMLQLCLRDTGIVQDAAVRTLLANGQRPEPAPFLSPANALLVRQARGDPDARRKVQTRLERAERALLWDPRAEHSPAQIAERKEMYATERMNQLLELAAYGSAEDRQRLRTFVQKGTENAVYAWLKLGGSAEEVLELMEDVLQIPPSELVRAGTNDALQLELARFARQLELGPRAASELQSIRGLVRRLAARDPNELLEVVGPVLRSYLELHEDAGHVARSILLELGDEQVVAEFGRMSPEEFGESVPRGLAAAPGDEAVRVLVDLLVRSLRGFDWDCTDQAGQNIVAISFALHHRNETERALALQLLDAVELQPRWGFTDVRWALGELPEPQELLHLGRSAVIVTCRLDLAEEAPRYAGALDELRKDPRRHAFALALLHDEQSVAALGAQFAGPCEDGRGFVDALFALAQMGTPEAAEWIHAALPRLDRQRRDMAYTELGNIESPRSLGRLAALCAADDDPGRPAARAFLTVLGRRP